MSHPDHLDTEQSTGLKQVLAHCPEPAINDYESSGGAASTGPRTWYRSRWIQFSISLSLEVFSLPMSALVCDYADTVVARCIHPGIGDFLRRVESHSDFPMLGWVDPYDDTVFNSRQISAVLAELASVSREFPESGRPSVVEELVAIAKLVPLKPHRYLIFSGD
ncbi:hypothetical protein [Nocardiopsis sp. YSL2]|uniref:hypothetical protein n=1 Tax=Nocardiopsis sp. YSL2 TaxID=2939492 RepID=UPI0026F468DF|nr:hypothetical protein [Nocardiopsis sp. YSL2]